MSEAEYIEKVVHALEKVPAKELLIIDLVNRYTKEGFVDYYELERVQPEVNLAIAEAKMYGSHTLMAVNALANLEAKAADVGPGHPALPE